MTRLPVQLSSGWAEADRWGGRGLCWAAAGCAAVWSDAGEARCGRPAAAGDGDGDGVDWGRGRAGDDGVAGFDWSTPNAAPPHLLRKNTSTYDDIYYVYFGHYCFFHYIFILFINLPSLKMFDSNKQWVSWFLSAMFTIGMALNINCTDFIRIS